jgi:hypothetical protein
MSLNDFIAKYNGHGLDFDGAYGFQCMDLMHGYITEVLGLPGNVLAAPTAFQAYEAGDDHFDRIPNTPEGIPQPGDIMFWNTSVGAAGHVAVFISGNANSFISFDQNWPAGSICHEQPHNNYHGVAGWLRLKGASAQGEEPVASPSADEVRSAAATYNQTFTEDQVTYYAARPWDTLLNDLLPAVNDQRKAAEAQLAACQEAKAPEPTPVETPLPQTNLTIVQQSYFQKHFPTLYRWLIG